MSCPAVGSVCGGPSHPPPLAGAPVTPSCPHSIRGKTKVPCWPGGDTRRVSDARSCSVPHLHIPPWATCCPRAGVPSGSPLPTSTPPVPAERGRPEISAPPDWAPSFPFSGADLSVERVGWFGGRLVIRPWTWAAASTFGGSLVQGGGVCLQKRSEKALRPLCGPSELRIAKPLLVTFSALGFLGCGYP